MAGTFDKSSWQTYVDLDFTGAATAQDVMDAPTPVTNRLKVTNLFVAVYIAAASDVQAIFQDEDGGILAKFDCAAKKQGDITLAPNTPDNLDLATKEVGFDLPAGKKLQLKCTATGAKIAVTGTGRVITP